MIIYNVYVYDNGDRYWHLNDKLHREDGPAIECADGTRRWYLSGQRHREDGPAVESANGDRYWYLNGKFHREDGPAVEYANGDRCWYLNDKLLSEEEFKERTQVKEMSVADLEKILGYPIKIVK